MFFLAIKPQKILPFFHSKNVIQMIKNDQNIISPMDCPKIFLPFPSASGVFNVYYGRQEEILRLGQLGLDLGTSAPAERWSHEKMVIFGSLW